MHFSFHSGSSARPALNTALEAVFSDGRVIQVINTLAGDSSGRNVRTVFAFREGRTGKWRDSAGLSMDGKPRTLENIARAIAKAEPDSEMYVFPTA